MSEEREREKRNRKLRRKQRLWDGRRPILYGLLHWQDVQELIRRREMLRRAA